MTIYSQPAPEVIHFFDESSNTFSYIVRDPSSQACAVIDPVLNFDYPSAHISFEGAEAIIQYIQEHKLVLEWLVETHVHADHISAASHIQGVLGGKLIISEKIVDVQNTFGRIYNEDAEFKRDGSQFDRLLKDGDQYQIGNLTATALLTPGHTPACMTHVVVDAAFVGDTLFMPDSGTARADFPGGDALELYQSTRRILSLPETTRLFMCHDYAPDGRELEYETTVAKQRAENVHVRDGICESKFTAMREERDSSLDMPDLILPSLQVNMRAGHLPSAEPNGMVYLKIPVNAFN